MKPVVGANRPLLSIPPKVVHLLRSRGGLVGIIGLAFLLRALSLDAQSMWRDEVDALRFALTFWERLQAARQPLQLWAEVKTLLTQPGWNGPLFFLLLRPWIGLVGSRAYALRFFSLLFGVLMVPLSAMLGRRLLNRTAGLLAALFVATSPYLVWYSQELKMYSLVPFLALLALYALHRAVTEGGKGWWGLVIVATTLAFYTHILAAFLIPLEVLLFLLWWPCSRTRWRGGLIALLSLTLPYLPLLRWQLPLVLQPGETGFTRYSLEAMASILLRYWSLGFMGGGWPWAAFLALVLALIGLTWREATSLSPASRPASVGGSCPLSPWRRTLALALWFLLPLLALWAISLRRPLFTDRYLAWTTVAFYLLTAAGLARLARRRRPLALLLLALLLFLNVQSLWTQAVTPFKADFRGAAAYLKARYRSGEPILFHLSYMRYNFDYYWCDERWPCTPEPAYPAAGAPAPGPWLSPQEVDRQMQALLQGHATFWLVASETEMWDPRGLVWEWLERHAEEVERRDFTRVSVVHYRLLPGR